MAARVNHAIYIKEKRFSGQQKRGGGYAVLCEKHAY